LYSHGNVNGALKTTLGTIQTNQKILEAANKNRGVSLNLPCFEVPLLRPVQCGADTKSYLSIGGRIKFDRQGIVDQSISVCLFIVPDKDITASSNNGTTDMKANTRYVVRRFHFDMDCNLDNKGWPISHIQYGGKILDDQKGDAEYHLIKNIDLPRIPSFPLDIIQVTNFFLHQFETCLKKPFSLPDWRSVVIENDNIWKEHYIKKMLEETSKTKKKTMYEWACQPIRFNS